MKGGIKKGKEKENLRYETGRKGKSNGKQKRTVRSEGGGNKEKVMYVSIMCTP